MSNNVTVNLFDLLQNESAETFFVAEAGLNHGGSKEKAMAMVRGAKWAGADAIKFQTFRADKLNSKTRAQLTHTKDVDLQDLFKKLELSFDDFRTIHSEAKRLGIEFLSTPFDEESADFLEELGVGAFKIASGDITHSPLVKHIARKGKPVLLSTGMSSSEEIEKAIDWIYTEENHQIILLHCVSAYPPKPEELNLKSIEFLRDRFGLPVGFSDHSVDSMGSIIASPWVLRSSSATSCSTREGMSPIALSRSTPSNCAHISKNCVRLARFWVGATSLSPKLRART